MRLCAVAIALGLLACHRGADELPASDAAIPAPISSITPSGRCVFPTPSAAPPLVSPGPARNCPRDPNPHTLALVTVQFPEATNGVAIAHAELSRTNEDSERGLMYRTQMDPDHGMLFDLGKRQFHEFWMHDTCISLDMLFIDDDGLVVGVLENVPPMNDTHRSVPCPSSHVLEMNAGWARRAGVRAGMHARLPGA
jgi:uncharacterized membrane protein (UPF0127 family)